MPLGLKQALTAITPPSLVLDVHRPRNILGSFSIIIIIIGDRNKQMCHFGKHKINYLLQSPPPPPHPPPPFSLKCIDLYSDKFSGLFFHRM